MVADLFSLLAQTASTKGEAGKGRITQRASTERKNEKGAKDSRGVGKGKAGKRLVRRLEQTSSVCLRRQLPRRGSRERANCAERFCREKNRERNERQPWRWKVQSGEKVGAAVGADLFSLLAQTASPKGEAGKGRIAQRASTERKAEKGTKDSRGVGKGKAERTGTIPRRAGIKIDEVYTHIRLRIRGNRFRKAIL